MGKFRSCPGDLVEDCGTVLAQSSNDTANHPFQSWHRSPRTIRHGRLHPGVGRLADYRHPVGDRWLLRARSSIPLKGSSKAMSHSRSSGCEQQIPRHLTITADLRLVVTGPEHCMIEAFLRELVSGLN